MQRKIDILFKFYADTELGDRNKYFCFRLYDIEGFTRAVTRFEDRGFTIRSGYIEIQDNGSPVLNKKVIWTSYRSVEYSIDNLKILNDILKDLTDLNKALTP